MRFQQSLIKNAQKFGVTQARRKYNKGKSYIYFCLTRYDGSIEFFTCHSRLSPSPPNAHTDAELRLIRDMRRRNPELGLVELWHRLRLRGYSRCVESL